MNNGKYLQQGDVLMFAIGTAIPSTAVKQESRVVQEGEHTGHAHRLASGNVYLDTATNEKYIELFEPTVISHEEHKPIELPPGNYRVGIVREYDHFSEEARAVAD